MICCLPYYALLNTVYIVGKVLPRIRSRFRAPPPPLLSPRIPPDIPYLIGFVLSVPVDRAYIFWYNNTERKRPPPATLLRES